MAKINQNFTMYSGNTEPIYFTVVDSTNSVIILDDTITFNWTMQLRGKNLATKSTGGNGITITDGSKGRVCVKLAAIDTSGVSGTCDHELRMTDGDGNITTVATGTVTVIHSLLDN